MSSELPQTGFVRLPQILSHIPVSRSTWWSRVKRGEYPPAYKLSANTTAWKAEDIHALISRLAQQGRNDTTKAV